MVTSVMLAMRLFFASLYMLATPRSSARACPLIADNNARPDEQVGRLRRRQQDTLHAGFPGGHSVLVIIPSAALNRAAVALAGVLQPDHGKLPFEQSAGCARILCAALAPQTHIVAVAGIVDGRAATAAADEALTVKSSSIFRVCNVAVDSAVFIRALRPCFIPGTGMAAHFEIAVTALIPFFSCRCSSAAPSTGACSGAHRHSCR